MATDSTPVFVDTNVLVYAKLARSAMHLTAVDALRNLDREGADLWISRQVLREYLAAMTRPGTLTDEIPLSALTDDVRVFSAQLQIAEDGPAVTERLLALMLATPVGGKQVHDANIVATMHVHGITRLLTHNTGDFNRFAGEIVLLPLAQV